MSIAIINAKTSWTTHRRNSFEALLSLDGRIRCLGTTAEVLAAREEAVRHYQSSSNASSPFQCEVMDLQHARCVYPGFMDAHAHFMDGGRSMSSLSLRGCKSKANFILAIKAFIVERNLPEGTWVVGGEWSEVDLSAVPTREWLDEATTKHFVFLTRFDLHSAVCSTLALQHAEISASTADPEGGVIVRAANGEPTGILRERALQLIKKKWPKEDTPDNNARAVAAATQYLLSHGVTSVCSMSTLSHCNMSDSRFLAAMALEGTLRIRVRNAVREEDIQALHAMYEENQKTRSQREPPYNFTVAGEASGGRGAFLRLGAVKFFADGSLGSRTAAMKAAYSNDCCNHGVLCTPADALLKGFTESLRLGFQTCCHAIGDRAVEVVNDNLQHAALHNESSVPAFKSTRPRVEHCQHVHSEGEIERMAKFGIVASVQPCHLLFDGDYIDDLLGEDRKNLSYVFKTMLDKGVQLALGSDWMVAPADVLDGLAAAVYRIPYLKQQAKIDSASGQNQETQAPTWNPSQRLTPSQALEGYTTGAAYAAFAEDELGRLELGFLADVTVWDADVLDYLELPYNPRNTKPKLVAAIVGGRVEFSSEKSK